MGSGIAHAFLPQPDSYAYLYVLMHPFSYLDERVISAIDLAEQGISSRQDEQAGTWALHKLAAQARVSPHIARGYACDWLIAPDSC